MSALDKFERIGKFGLIGIFFCSTLLFGIYLFTILWSWNHMHASYHDTLTLFPRKALGVIINILFYSIIFLAVWRYLCLKTLAIKNPSLRSALKDEHTSVVRLTLLYIWRFSIKSYRPRHSRERRGDSGCGWTDIPQSQRSRPARSRSCFDEGTSG